MINPPVLDIDEVTEIVAKTKPDLCSSIVNPDGVLLVSDSKNIARISAIGQVTVYVDAWESRLSSLITAIWNARIAKLPVAA